MAAQNTQSEAVLDNAQPAVASCWKKKSDDATFFEGLKDRFDEFMNTSMDDRKACFKNTFQNAFGMSKILGNKQNSETKEAEDSVPSSTS